MSSSSFSTKPDESVEDHLRRIEINPAVLEKILKWKGDSEKYREYTKTMESNSVFNATQNLVKNQEIVERLKKLNIIEKIEQAYLYCNRDHHETRMILTNLKNELQKILDGENG